MRFGKTTKILQSKSALAAAVTLVVAARAETGGHPITLEQAVSYALSHHPTVRFSEAREQAARARVDEARTTELPGLGVSGQINRSTGNTVPGTFFPLAGFPPIAGAPRGRTLDSGVWQTGVGVWSSWDLTALVREAAQVDVALAGSREAEAASSARKLEIAYATADAFIALCEAREFEKAAAAGVERARVFGGVVKSLVAQNLRPGVDAARADAELALAETDLARAEQNEAARRAAFAEALGDKSARFDPVPGSLLGPAGPGVSSTETTPEEHPLVREAEAAAQRARRTESVTHLEYLPRVEILGALWLRGSGLYGSPGDGLVPDIPNWAAGATVSWSVLDIPRIEARSRAASADARAQAAHRDETELAIAGQMETATAILRGATRVAETTPTALASARQAEEQALARYRSGLTQAVEVADAEHLLTQAEVNDALARLEVRRAELLVARAAGDVGPFLAHFRSDGGKR